jgi:threonine aldolase
MNFSSDNWAGISPRILAAITTANAGYAPAYGADSWTETARQAFVEAFGHDLAMATVPTGTAANSLAIAVGCGATGLLICHEEAHMVSAEAESRKALNPDLEIVTIKGVGGKLAPADLERTLSRLDRAGRPALFSITNVTEAGLVYRPAEIAALAKVAKKHGFKVHVDGARFGNAVAATGASPADLSWRSGVDLVSFGATKSGALAAEAVIAFDTALASTLLETRKALGYTFSKGRFIGCQLAAYLADGHWLDLARHANAAAARLARGMKSRGVDLAWPCEANEVLAILDGEAVKSLRAAGARCHDWSLLGNQRPERPLRRGEGIVRFVASFATADAEVDAVLSALDVALPARAPAHAM